MGLFDLLKRQQRQEPPVESRTAQAAPPAANPGNTRMEREHFLLHAPFQWMAVPGDNPLEFEFRNKTLAEQLIVTVLPARTPVEGAQQRAAAERLVTARLTAISILSKGQGVHSPVQYQTGSGQTEARCVGRDSSQGLRFAFVIRVAQSKAVTVALTRYFMEEVGTPFEVYAGIIFDLLQVKEPDGPVRA